VVWPALPALLPPSFFCFFFLPKIRGGPGLLGPSARSVAAFIKEPIGFFRHIEIQLDSEA